MSKPNIQSMYPLTPMQEGMLYHHLYDPTSQAYFQQLARDLTDVRPELLRRACEQLVERHEVLRTLIVWKKRESPIQIVRRHVELPWHEVDLRDEPNPLQKLAEFEREDRNTGFILDRAPLVRMTLFRLADQKYRFYWSSHHIILDGASLDLVMNEMMTLYRGQLSGSAPAPAPRAFRDYLAWLKQQRAEETETRWREYLEGVHDATAPPMVDSDQTIAETLEFTLPASGVKTLRDFAKARQITLSTLFQGMLGAGLCRYCGRKEAVFGSVVSGRPAALQGSDKMVGMFVNTLPMRTTFHADQETGAWLKDVQDRWQAIQEHAHVALTNLQAWTDVPRGEPLFQVMTAVQPADFAPTKEDFSIRPGDLYEYPLVVVVDMAEAVRFRFTYHVNRLDADWVGDLAKAYRKALETVTADDHRTLAQWFDLDDATLKRLQTWNTHDLTHDPERNLVGHFIENVARHPDQEAVMCDDESMTYGMLDRLSNQLANMLVRDGVRPGDPVGLFMDRGIANVVAVLAIVKTGAYYVPAFTARQGEDLINYFFDDADLRHLLMLSKYRDRIPSRPNLTIVELDNLEALLKGERETFEAVFLSAEQPVALLYTSGSTGLPKGALLPQRGMVNLLDVANHKTDEDTRMLHAAALSFDLAQMEIWASLLGGGVLVIYSGEVELGVEDLAKLMEDAKVTHAMIVTSVMNELAHYADRLGHSRHLISGGEVMNADSIATLMKAAPEAAFYNLYGPTENTVLTTDWPIPRDTSPPKEAPIGRPLTGIQVYVLDDHLNLTPPGVVGQLCVAGRGIAPGYWKRPRLTAERFLPNPHSGISGDRFFAIGDLGLLDDDDQLRFRGRMDHQVKIRGFRVEPAGLEALIRKQPGIVEAVVKAVPGKSGGKRLIAWYTSETEQSEQALREALTTNVPDYMLPTALIKVDPMPRLPSGKIDRKTLLPPADDAERAAPRNSLEQEVAELWKEAFGLEAVGIHDDFFDLGGHSMLAARLIDKVRRQFEIDTPMRLFLENPTVAGYAKIVEDVKQGGAEALAEQALDLEQEVALDRAVWPPMEFVDFYEQPSQVLLTGATGFVGAFLLESLLRQTKARVICLVRADSPTQGLNRLRENMNKYLLDVDFSRVEALPGDLGKPRWDIDEETWNRLAQDVDAIYHNGAFVHFLYPYNTLKPANVGGVEEGLRLACAGRLKPFHFVSTVGVLRSSTSYRKSPIMEDDLLEDWSRLNGGYSQSKWVGEKVVSMAAARGAPVAIYRIGRITGDTRTGACDEGSLLMRSIQAWVQLGAAPGNGEDFDMTPVDYLADALVQLSRQVDNNGLTFHIENPHKAIRHRKLVDWLKGYGYKIKTMPYDRWLQHLVQSLQRGEENALRPLLPNFEDMAPGRQPQNMQAMVSRLGLRDRRKPQFDQTNTQRGLEQTDIRCPPINDALLTTYVTYLIERGYLKPPHA